MQSLSFSHREKVAEGRMRVLGLRLRPRDKLGPSSAASRHLLPVGEGQLGEFAIYLEFSFDRLPNVDPDNNIALGSRSLFLFDAWRIGSKMRTLIDGYNVMFAAGLLGKRFGSDGFRRVRTRFLNDLALKLGPTQSHLTTVVFDAKKVPEGLPSQIRHKGITVCFAVNNPTADERIGELIKCHSDPKRLTVISSDNQIRTAARRRKAQSVTADDFLTKLVHSVQDRIEVAEAAKPEKPGTLSQAESDYWVREFGAIERSGELEQAFGRDPMFPSDEEIEKIKREVEQEFREGR